MGYARFLANYPYIIVGVVSAVSVICLIVILVVASEPDFSDPKLGFEARGTELSARIKSYQRLLDSTNGILTRSENHFISTSELGSRRDIQLRRNATKSKRRHNKKTTKLRLKYKKDNENIGAYPIFNETAPGFFCELPGIAYARYTYSTNDKTNLFTLDNIKTMCKFDEDIRRAPTFHKNCVRTTNEGTECCRTWSLGNYIALLTNHTSCSELMHKDVDMMVDLLHECIVHADYLTICAGTVGDPDSVNEHCQKIPPKCLYKDAVYQILHFITDINFVTKQHRGHSIKLTYAMTFIPLAIGKSTRSLYQILTNEIGLSYDNIEIVAVKFGLKQIMFDEFLKKDAVWFALALVTVILVMWFYSASIFITLMAIASVLITLVISYFIYSVIFEIDFFPYMNLMSVVLLIGVGMDDICLYCRIWTLAKLERNIGTLEKVISDTLKHATLSMFVTSLTTSAALYANIVSKITALKCFAIFGGTTILVNFILMITWIPATIVVHDKWCSDCCCCHPEYNSSSKGLYPRMCKFIDKVSFRISEWSRIFFEKLLPHAIIKLRYLWIFLFGLISTLGLVAVVFYPKLKLPTSNEFQMFAQSHPFEVYDFQIKDQFWFEKAAGTTKATVPLTVIWGVEPRDTGSKLNPFSKTELKYHLDFNTNTEEGQRFFLKFCREVRSSQWYQNGMDQQFTTVNCFIEGFRRFMEKPCDGIAGSFRPCCKESPFPYTHQVYIQCLKKWMSDLEKYEHFGYYIHPNAGPRFSKETGEMVAIIAEVNSNQPYSFNYKSMKKFYNDVDEWVQSKSSLAPPGFEGAWFVSDLSFYDLQNSIATGTPLAIGVSIGIASIFAFLTTLNVLITLWAMISISGTIFAVVGILVLLGWQLNIMESVTITVAVGLAIDFTLHFGMAYRLSPGLDREARMLCATQRVGSVVTVAAISSFLAGLFMVPSTIYAYRQLGIFLMLIMSFSWLYATFFFQSLLRVFGPVGGFSQFHWPTIHCDICVQSEHVDKTVYTVSDETVSSSSTNNPMYSTSETHELEVLSDEEHKTTSKHLPHLHSTFKDNHSENNPYRLNGSQKSVESEETFKTLLSEDTSLKSPMSIVVSAAVENRVLSSNNNTEPKCVLAEVERDNKSTASATKQNGSNNNIWNKNEIFV